MLLSCKLYYLLMNKYVIYREDVFTGLDRVPTASIDLAIVDPPYFVLTSGKVAREEAEKYPEYQWDKFPSVHDYASFTSKWFSLLRTKMKNNSYIFIFWSQKYQSLGHEIFEPARTLIWEYDNLLNSPKGDFTYDYEPIFVIKIGKPKLALRSKSVLRFTKPQSNFKSDKAVYPTQKPRPLIAHLLRAVGLPKGSLVLDCFQGSGVTGEQALLQKLNYIGIDKDPSSEKIATELLLCASNARTLLDQEEK